MRIAREHVIVEEGLGASSLFAIFPSLVQGKTTAAPAECMRRMADAGSPFVKS